MAIGCGIKTSSLLHAKKSSSKVKTKTSLSKPHITPSILAGSMSAKHAFGRSSTISYRAWIAISTTLPARPSATPKDSTKANTCRFGSFRSAKCPYKTSKNVCAMSTKVHRLTSPKAPMPDLGTANSVTAASASNCQTAKPVMKRTRCSTGTNVRQLPSKPLGLSSHKCVHTARTVSSGSE